MRAVRDRGGYREQLQIVATQQASRRPARVRSTTTCVVAAGRRADGTAWLRRPSPMPATSTPDAGSRSGEPIAPAETTTASASIVVPSARPTPVARPRRVTRTTSTPARSVDAVPGEVGVGGRDPADRRAGMAPDGVGRRGEQRPVDRPELARPAGCSSGTRTRASAVAVSDQPQARTGASSPAVAIIPLTGSTRRRRGRGERVGERQAGSAGRRRSWGCGSPGWSARTGLDERRRPHRPRPAGPATTHPALPAPTTTHAAAR